MKPTALALLLFAGVIASITPLNAQLFTRFNQLNTHVTLPQGENNVAIPIKRTNLQLAQSNQALSANKLYIDVNDTKRSYYLFSGPSTSKKGIPLLVMLHGGAGSAESSIHITRLGSLGPASGIDVLFPEGSNLGHPFRWNTGLTTGTEIDKVADTQFIDELVKKYTSVERPVYLAGLSNGGMMVLKQLCNGKTSFNGAFVVAGGTSQQILDSCNPKTKLPILFVNGIQDSVVPYSGGLVIRGGRKKSMNSSETPLVSNTSLVDFWRRKNSCKDKSSYSSPLLHLRSDNNLRIKNFRLPPKQCYQTLSIALYSGDHGWPINTDELTWEQRMRLKLKQRVAGSLIGKNSVDPGNLDTTGVVLTLIKRWSSVY